MCKRARREEDLAREAVAVTEVDSVCRSDGVRSGDGGSSEVRTIQRQAELIQEVRLPREVSAPTSKLSPSMRKQT